MPNKSILSRLVILIATLITTQGCGFKLQGAMSLPEELNKIYYKASHPYEKFEQAFKRKLKSSGTTILPKPQANVPTLTVSSEYSNSCTITASSAQARIYTLIYTARIEITDYDNKTILPLRTATVSRSITLQPNEVIGSTLQVDTAKQEMLQELSKKLLNILGSRNTSKILRESTLKNHD